MSNIAVYTDASSVPSPQSGGSTVLPGAKIILIISVITLGAFYVFPVQLTNHL